MTGGAAIVEAARANGMTTIFGVPGVQIYPLFDALHGTDVTAHRAAARASGRLHGDGLREIDGAHGRLHGRTRPRRPERRGGAVHRHGQLLADRVLDGPSAVVVPRSRPRTSARARRPARDIAHPHQRTPGASTRRATLRGSSTTHFATRPAAAPGRSPSRCAGTRWRRRPRPRSSLRPRRCPSPSVDRGRNRRRRAAALRREEAD